MALTLEQYASYLDSKSFQWPVPIPATSLRAKPHLKSLRGIKAVTWTIYGTLLQINEGDLKFTPENQLILNIALGAS